MVRLTLCGRPRLGIMKVEIVKIYYKER